MFTSGELAAITAEFARSIGTASGVGAAVTLYRLTGTVEGTLTPQDARVIAALPGNETAQGATRGTTANVFLMMAPGANVAKDDRFYWENQAYIVTGVRPNRQIRTWADAQVIQP